MADLERQDEIAVDTEADSFYSYREKVCLVQMTVEDRDYLVDPLASLDLQRLGRILADPTKTKVFHDSEYDVLILKRQYAFEFAGLFDTRVAAAALGTSSPGLAAVLETHFGVELDKSQQRSNWAKRPLTDEQVRYARLDTHYLLALMAELKPELEACGRMMIVEGECRRLEQLQPVEPSFNPDEFVRIKGARALKPVERQALRELYRLRDTLAREWDVPPFRVMTNQLLLDLARIRPRTLRALTAMRGFSPRMARRQGKEVLECLGGIARLGPLNRMPTLPRRDGTGGMSDDQAELYERLKQWRKGAAVQEGIESSYLLNRHVMARIAREFPGDEEQLARVDGLLPWQLEMFGEEILEVLTRFRQDLDAGSTSGRPPRRG